MSEFADASRFADARNRPQGLPGMMLSAALASKVVRTFAVAVYDTEVTCLIKVRTADAAIISQAKLLPGAFLQAQRDPDAHIVGLRGVRPKRPINTALASVPKSPRRLAIALLIGQEGVLTWE